MGNLYGLFRNIGSPQVDRIDADKSFDRKTALLIAKKDAVRNGSQNLYSKGEEMKTKIGTIDLTPTWRALLPVFLLALEEGTEEGKQIAREELGRMADAADGYNKLTKEKSE